MIFGEKPWGYFKGWLRWAVNKKMSHPRKSAPESLKTRPSEFLACAVNSRRIHEALELKSRRLSRQTRPFIPAGNQANPEGSLFRGTFCGNFCWPVFEEPLPAPGSQHLDITAPGAWPLKRCWVFGHVDPISCCEIFSSTVFDLIHGWCGMR